MFGGHGIDAVGNLGNLNDLWSYSPDTGIWTWNSGSNVSGAYGIYGTQGVSSNSILVHVSIEYQFHGLVAVEIIDAGR